VDLAEYIEKEILNDKKIENDHQTVLVVANYLDKNPDIAKYYDYLVDWRMTNDEQSHNFHAKFRLKPQFRRDVSKYTVAPGYATGVKPYRAQYQAQREQSYGGYYYEKENLGPVGDKYYSEPVEYEYVVEQRAQPSYVYEDKTAHSYQYTYER
jgi:hypothetical protein